jgi:hypothetical protein
MKPEPRQLVGALSVSGLDQARLPTLDLLTTFAPVPITITPGIVDTGPKQVGRDEARSPDDRHSSLGASSYL